MSTKLKLTARGESVLGWLGAIGSALVFVGLGVISYLFFVVVGVFL